MKTLRTASRAAVRPVLGSALLLMVPLLAMQVTDEVAWDLVDFATAGALLLGTGLAYELAARRAAGAAYRAAVGTALATALLLVWIDLAVGIIGDRPNLIYLGVLAVGVVGSAVARLRPSGMSRAMLVTALVPGLIAVDALIAGAGRPLEVVGVNGMFVAGFVGSALLFRRAARERAAAGTGPAV